MTRMWAVMPVTLRKAARSSPGMITRRRMGNSPRGVRGRASTRRTRHQWASAPRTKCPPNAHVVMLIPDWFNPSSLATTAITSSRCTLPSVNSSPSPIRTKFTSSPYSRMMILPADVSPPLDASNGARISVPTGRAKAIPTAVSSTSGLDSAPIIASPSG